MKKVTPQEMLDAYNHACATSSPEAQQFFPVLSEKLEDLTDKQRAIFQHMALGMNCIVGEMCVEEQ